MSSVSAAASTFIAQQMQARQQTMMTAALKQNAQQGQAIADMLQVAAQASAGAIAPGQGTVIDIRA